jgi:hypothetical protein
MQSVEDNIQVIEDRMLEIEEQSLLLNLICHIVESRTEVHPYFLVRFAC